MKISVCMAVYNGAAYLPAQLSSILMQLGPADEVVVIDDGSKDRSWEIIEGYADPRIRLLKNPQNLGVVGTFERALTLATGDILFLADQDDVWQPDKVAKMSACFKDPNCLAVVCDATVIDAEDQLMYPSYFKLRNSGPGVWHNFYKNTYLGCCMALTAKAKPYILPFPKFIPMHDEWIGLSCQIHGEVVFLPEPLTGYRRHGQNQTKLTGFDLPHILQKRVVWLGMILTALTQRFQP